MWLQILFQSLHWQVQSNSSSWILASPAKCDSVTWYVRGPTASWGPLKQGPWGKSATMEEVWVSRDHPLLRNPRHMGEMPDGETGMSKSIQSTCPVSDKPFLGECISLSDPAFTTWIRGEWLTWAFLNFLIPQITSKLKLLLLVLILF